jgi:hypothetical protein
LLDEDHHLWLLDGTGFVLVEGGENLIEGLMGELVSRTEVFKSVLDELLGLLLIEYTAVVDIISVPDLFDNVLDSFIFGGCLCILFILYIFLSIYSIPPKSFLKFRDHQIYSYLILDPLVKNIQKENR